MLVLLLLFGLSSSIVLAQATTPENGRPDSIAIAADAKPDFGPFMKKFLTTIRKNWNPPKRDYTYEVVALVTVNQDGSLKKIEIQKSSNQKILDNAAIAAINASAPFDPLPVEYHKPTVQIQYKFDYQVTKKSEPAPLGISQFREMPFDDLVKIAIYQHWHPVVGSKAFSSTYMLTVAWNGQLINTVLLKSSGYKAVDAMALKTIVESAPFKPIFMVYKHKVVSIIITLTTGIPYLNRFGPDSPGIG